MQLPRLSLLSLVNQLAGGGAAGPSQKYFDLQERKLALEVAAMEKLAGNEKCEGKELSAVLAHSRAAIIVGAVGSGKSVTAAAIAKAGSAPVVAYKRPFSDYPVVDAWNRIPRGALVVVDEAADLHAERGESKPTEAFAVFLARCRHNGNRTMILAQSWKQIPTEALSVDMGQILGFKRTSWLARQMTRPEVLELSAAAAAVLETMPPHQGVTVWSDLNGKMFSTWNGFDASA